MLYDTRNNGTNRKLKECKEASIGAESVGAPLRNDQKALIILLFLNAVLSKQVVAVKNTGYVVMAEDMV